MESAVKDRNANASTKPITTQTTKRRGATAEEMAARQKDVSVSEFFVKNRHLALENVVIFIHIAHLLIAASTCSLLITIANTIANYC